MIEVLLSGLRGLPSEAGPHLLLLSHRHWALAMPSA